MTNYTDQIACITEFSEWIRARTETRDGNLLCLGIGEWKVYLGFLTRIGERYEEAQTKFSEASAALQASVRGKSGRIDDEQLRLWDELSKASYGLRLEIESYLLFVSVLLNKIANLPDKYFVHTERNGLAVGSHERLWISLRKKTFYPTDLGEVARWLTENVVDHRDLYIVHTQRAENEKRLLIRGLSGSRTIGTVLYPDEGEEPYQVVSPAIEEVSLKVSEYVIGLVSFLQKEVGRSVLQKRG